MVCPVKRLFPFTAFIATPFLFAGLPAVVTSDNVRTFYQKFVRLTAGPHRVGDRAAFTDLCQPALSRDQEAEDKKKLGPHFSGLVHYYANAEATRALQQSAKEFPEGSIFVKEKLGSAPDGKSPAPVVEIGGMIKRAKGFNPAGGDWEFFFSDSEGKFSAHAQLASCVDCHKAAVQDHIYAAWQFAPK